MQGRYYEVGAEISRTEQTIEHTRELRERQKHELAQARGRWPSCARTSSATRSSSPTCVRRSKSWRPMLERHAGRGERAAATLWRRRKQAAADWQQRWEDFNRELGAAHQTTQVERARIEQLENQLRRLAAQADRLAVERETLAGAESRQQLGALARQESMRAQQSRRAVRRRSAQALDACSRCARSSSTSKRDLEARARRSRAHALGVVSLEALQKAALSREADRARRMAGGRGPRQATARRAAAGCRLGGWERAVETALGDYLEAVCVDELDDVAGALDELTSGRVALIEAGGHTDSRWHGEPAVARGQRPAAVMRLAVARASLRTRWPRRWPRRSTLPPGSPS